MSQVLTLQSVRKSANKPDRQSVTHSVNHSPVSQLVTFLLLSATGVI